MNPINIFFQLAYRQADIRRAFAIYKTIKSPLTELIDLCRSILGDIGMLDEQANPDPSPLAVYDTKWVQRSLNELMDAGLTVDGELGVATVNAVKRFQAANPPLRVDGSPGVQTAAAIAAALAKHRS